MKTDRELADYVAIPEVAAGDLSALNRYITGIKQAIFSQNKAQALKEFINTNSSAYSETQIATLKRLNDSDLERIATLLREDYTEMSLETDLD